MHIDDILEPASLQMLMFGGIGLEGERPNEISSTGTVDRD